MTRAGLDVYLHVGAPKSGTTFVQRVLWSSREQLRADGVLYPYTQPTEHFTAMLDLREVGWGGIRREAVRGAWDRVAERVRDWDGHAAILSNELLGRASAPQISRLIDSVAPANVFVVYTARDLARQLVSSWQEQVKHNLAVTFDEFVTVMLEHGPHTHPPFGRLFWPLQDVDFVLSRWGSVVGHDRVRLVTVPPPDGPKDALWERFCAATHLDPQRYRATVSPRNVSLSVAEAEYFRRVNAGAKGLAPRDYTALVRNGLMRKVGQSHGERLTLPKQSLALVQQRSLDMVEQLRHHGFPVVGDLDDLVPNPEDHADGLQPGEVRDDELLPLAMESVHSLLKTAADQRARIHQLTTEQRAGSGGRSSAPAWSQVRARARQVRRSALAVVSRLRPGTSRR